MPNYIPRTEDWLIDFRRYLRMPEGSSEDKAAKRTEGERLRKKWSVEGETLDDTFNRLLIQRQKQLPGPKAEPTEVPTLPEEVSGLGSLFQQGYDTLSEGLSGIRATPSPGMEVMRGKGPPPPPSLPARIDPASSYGQSSVGRQLVEQQRQREQAQVVGMPIIPTAQVPATPPLTDITTPPISPVGTYNVPSTPTGAFGVPPSAGPGPTTPQAPQQPDRITQLIEQALQAPPPSDTPPWAIPLMTAGFTMASSPSPYFLQALGQGGLAGAGAYAAQTKGKKESALAEREMALKAAGVLGTAKVQESTAEMQQAQANLMKLQQEHIGPTKVQEYERLREEGLTKAEAVQAIWPDKNQQAMIVAIITALSSQLIIDEDDPLISMLEGLTGITIAPGKTGEPGAPRGRIKGGKYKPPG